MNIRQTCLLIGLAAAITAPSAYAEDTAWYVGINVSETDLDNIDTNSTSQVGGVTRRIGIDTDSDTGFGITVGRSLFTSDNGNTLSVELNYSESDHDLENLRFMNNNFLASEGRGAGSAEVETIQARLKYQFDLGAFKPYLGVGISQSDLSVEAIYGGSIGSTPGAQPPFAIGSDSATSIELRAGLAYQLTDSLDAFIEYTSNDVDDIEFSRRGGGPGGLATTTQEGDFEFDSVSLGINFRF